MTRQTPNILLVAVAALASAGCHEDMVDQPRSDALEASDFFDDGRAARPLVPGVVPYGAPSPGAPLQTGRENGQLLAELPVEPTEALLRRGQQRFDIFCSNCHSRVGDGDGMIVRRGYRRPPTFHSDRLRGVPIGHYFDVMTNGFGAMPSYALQISVADRWAIAAYIRALQLSQHATADELPADVRRNLERGSSGALPSP